MTVSMIKKEENAIKSWNAMMFSARKACKILNEEFREPEWHDFKAGRQYLFSLWGKVKIKGSSKISVPHIDNVVDFYYN